MIEDFLSIQIQHSITDSSFAWESMMKFQLSRLNKRSREKPRYLGFLYVTAFFTSGSLSQRDEAPAPMASISAKITDASRLFGLREIGVDNGVIQ